MIVEKEDGTKEPLIDTGSFAAGYRQAVLDLSGGVEPTPNFPLIFFTIFFVILLLVKLGSLVDYR
jgi:hypothetical protein